MKAKEVQKFKTRLNKLRIEIQEMEASAKESTQPVELDQTRVGRLSRMDAMQGQQMAKQGERRRQQQLVMIQAALKRIDEDTYGYCIICEEDIDTRRLDFDPSITRCIKCAK